MCQKFKKRIVLGLTIPVEQGRQDFTPDLILISPGFKTEGKVHEKLEISQGFEVKSFQLHFCPGKVKDDLLNIKKKC